MKKEKIESIKEAFNQYRFYFFCDKEANEVLVFIIQLLQSEKEEWQKELEEIEMREKEMESRARKEPPAGEEIL